MSTTFTIFNFNDYDDMSILPGNKESTFQVVEPQKPKAKF